MRGSIRTGAFLAAVFCCSAGYAVPATPVVTDDGAWTRSATSLHASWTSSDRQTEVVEYRYAIGASSADPGTGYMVPWTSTGTNTEVTRTGLALSNGKDYYFYVKVKNKAGEWSGVGVSDGIRCVKPTDTVAATGVAANRHVIGGYQTPFGTEFWSPSGLEPRYANLLDKWKFGTIRGVASNSRFAWDAQRVPYVQGYHRSIEQGMKWNSFADADGHILGIDGHVAVASRSNAALCCVINMEGCADSYGKAVKIDGKTIQGAGVTGYKSVAEPTVDEKANWCNPNSDHSIYARARQLVSTLKSKESISSRVYELGNEIYSLIHVPEAYWKSGKKIERVAYGDHWIVTDRLSQYHTYDEYVDLRLDWTNSANTGKAGNALYIGFPYKPWMLQFIMKVAGSSNGSVVWQHHRADGNWDTIDPAGALEEYDNKYLLYDKKLDPVELSRIKNFHVADHSCNLFLLPLFQAHNHKGKLCGYNEQDWAADSSKGGPSEEDHHYDWERTQPAEIGGSNVRKLYWLKIYADAPYTKAPVEARMHLYLPDPRSWLDVCSRMYDVIKSEDPAAVVFNSGLALLGTTYTDSMNIYMYRNRPYWYYLKTVYKDKWDGLVIHPYVVATPSDVINRVDAPGAGLMQHIQAFRDLLDGMGPDGKKKLIACTEWGNLSSKASLADGLFNLEGTMEMLRDRPDGRPTVDYATWFMLSSDKGGFCNPFYTTPRTYELVKGEQIYPTANTKYIVRPVGLAMEMTADSYRSFAHDVTSSVNKDRGKSYAFSADSQTASMVMINKERSQQIRTVCWAAVAGKKVYARVLQSADGSLESNNEDPDNLQVTLSDQQYVFDVAKDGTFQVTLPAFSAMSLEFRTE